MTIFHEIYGVYFRIVRELLRHKRLKDSDVTNFIWNEGFQESVMFLPQKILPPKQQSPEEEPADWGLFRRNANGTISPVTKYDPPCPLTILQKRWLRTRLDDPRMGLFLSGEEREQLRAQLDGIEPLYTPEMLRFTDQCKDGDPYEDPQYQQHFRDVLTAAQNREIMSVTYYSGKNNVRNVAAVPFCIEYSEKDDKIRVFCVEFKGHKENRVSVLNLARIRSLERTGKKYRGSIRPQRIFSHECKSVTVRVTPERNAVERFLMEFASYRKDTQRDAETEVITVKFYYNRNDETEILIRLLSYGPMLEILSPPEFRAQAAERIRRQCELLK